MKLLKRNISAKDASGFLSLRLETPEDLWHAYNLLQPPTDIVTCTTLRKVIQTSSTGSTTSSKVRMNLALRIQKVDFDPESLSVRLSGQNVKESNHVRMGAHHTLTLEPGRTFSIEKQCWDQIYLDIIEESCNPENGAEICALVMHLGLAHLCLVTDSLTITKAKIETSIPKKRTGSNNNSKAILKFHEAIYRAILLHIDFTKIKVMLLASPGYVKDDFYKYLIETSIRRDDRPIIEHKSKFFLCKSSSGHKHALEDIFANPDIMSQLTETKVATEVKILNQFMRMIDTNPDKAYYGYNHVQKANEELAIDILLVTDELFRNSHVTTRKKYVDLVESVQNNGGKVYIFSSLHVSGTQLQQVSGVAAILRYPLPDIDQLETDAIYHSSDGDDTDDDINSPNPSSSTTLHDLQYSRIREDMQDMGLDL